MSRTHATPNNDTTSEVSPFPKSLSILAPAGNRKKSVDKALSRVAAPAAIATVLLPSINSMQTCTVLRDNPKEEEINNSDKNNRGQINSMVDNVNKKGVLTHEKECGTPTQRFINKVKSTEEIEPVSSTIETTGSNLLTKVIRRCSHPKG